MDVLRPAFARRRGPSRLQTTAHKLRGGLLVFEAKEAVAVAEELEHRGREGRAEDAEALAKELRGALEKLLDYLEVEASAGR